MSNIDSTSELDELVHASEEEIRVLRKEIERLQNDITTLKTRRNMCTSRLVQLPTEIIARVLFFSQCAQARTWSIRDGAVSTPWVNFDLRWTRYMLVCRRLREVGVGSPQLWSLIWYPANVSKTRMALYIERAKDCPLDLYGNGFSLRDWDGDPNTPQTTTLAIRRCLQTARRIYIPQPSRAKSAASGGSFVEQEMPRVETLYCSSSIYGVLQDHYHFSSHFLGGSSHTLRSLTLQHVSLSGTTEAPELPALVYLEVHVNDKEEPQHLDQLAALLRHTPYLETLAIRCRVHMVAHTCGPVSLPRLHTMKLSGLEVDLADVIRLLNFPSRRLYVDCLNSTGNEPTLRDFVLSFWAAASGSSHLPDGSCHRGYNEQHTISFGTSFDVELNDDHPSPHIYYTVCTSALHDMLMPLATVTTLVFENGTPFRTDALFSMLGTSVKQVVLNGMEVEPTFRTQLIDYLWQRRSTGYPVARIQFLNYVGGANDYKIKKFVDMLKDKDLDGCVVWV